MRAKTASSHESTAFFLVSFSTKHQKLYPTTIRALRGYKLSFAHRWDISEPANQKKKKGGQRERTPCWYRAPMKFWNKLSHPTPFRVTPILKSCSAVPRVSDNCIPIKIGRDIPYEDASHTVTEPWLTSLLSPWVFVAFWLKTTAHGLSGNENDTNEGGRGRAQLFPRRGHVHCRQFGDRKTVQDRQS